MIINEILVEAAGVELFNVLTVPNLLILRMARRAKKAALPISLYVYCTKLLRHFRKPGANRGRSKYATVLPTAKERSSSVNVLPGQSSEFYPVTAFSGVLGIDTGFLIGSAAIANRKMLLTRTVSGCRSAVFRIVQEASRLSARRNCHQRTGACPALFPLPHSSARYARTVLEQLRFLKRSMGIFPKRGVMRDLPTEAQTGEPAPRQRCSAVAQGSSETRSRTQ